MIAPRPESAASLNALGRAIGTLALIALFGVLAWKAGKEALADAYLRSATREVARPATTATPSPKDSWLRARQDLADSLRYSPRNPRTLQEAGLHDLRAVGAGIDATLYKVFVRSAYKKFRAALARRPTAADDWANLALAKFYLAEWDPEALAALEHADALGPWEFPVQREVLFVRLNAWSRLDENQRAETVRIVERATRHNADEVAQLLRQFNRLDLLCGKPGFDAKVQALCAPTRPSAPAGKPPVRRRGRHGSSS